MLSGTLYLIASIAFDWRELAADVFHRYWAKLILVAGDAVIYGLIFGVTWPFILRSLIAYRSRKREDI